MPRLAKKHVGVWKHRKWVKEHCLLVNETGTALSPIDSIGEIREGARVVHEGTGTEHEIFLYDFTANRVFLERVKDGN